MDAFDDLAVKIRQKADLRAAEFLLKFAQSRVAYCQNVLGEKVLPQLERCLLSKCTAGKSTPKKKSKRLRRK